MKCFRCSSNIRYKIFSGTSWVSSLFVALIPKCSLCIVAYSSAITLCGGKEMYLDQRSWLSYMPLLFSAVIMLMIILNRKDQRTLWALGLASVGALIMLSIHQEWLFPSYYYIGAALLALAIWINGSFFSVMNKLNRKYLTNLSWPR